MQNPNFNRVLYNVLAKNKFNVDLKKYFLDKNLESMFGSKHAQINPKLLDESSGNIVGSNDAQIKKPICT